MPRSVLVLGATGLVGQETLSFLLGDHTVSRVVVLSRRATGVQHAKLEEHLIDLSAMERLAHCFAVDQIVCALGTTIRAAGSRERFRAVDHDFPLAAARLGLAHGAHHYLLVSSMGANDRSRFFYNRVKGETENAVLALGYRSATILRPSLLLGNRKELRIGEQIASRLGWLMPPRLQPIHATAVARALVELAREDAPGARVLESRELRLR